MLHFEKIDWDGSEETRKKGNHIYYQIYNDKRQYLGEIRKMRVGRFMHWCFCPDLGDDFDNFTVGDLYFTNGCMKEISKFITGLYNEEKNNRTSDC